MAASTLCFLAHGAKRINGLLKPPNSFQPLFHCSRNRGLAGPGTWAGARVGGMGARPEEGQLVPMASGKSLQTEEGHPAEAGTGAFPEPRGPQGCSQGQGEVFGSDSEGTGTAGRLWAEAPSGWEWAEPAKGEVSRGWMWGDLGQPGQAPWSSRSGQDPGGAGGQHVAALMTVLSWGLSWGVSVQSWWDPLSGTWQPWGQGRGRAQHSLFLPCGAGTGGALSQPQKPRPGSTALRSPRWAQNSAPPQEPRPDATVPWVKKRPPQPTHTRITSIS